MFTLHSSVIYSYAVAIAFIPYWQPPRFAFPLCFALHINVTPVTSYWRRILTLRWRNCYCRRNWICQAAGSRLLSWPQTNQLTLASGDFDSMKRTEQHIDHQRCLLRLAGWLTHSTLTHLAVTLATKRPSREQVRAEKSISYELHSGLLLARRLFWRFTIQLIVTTT